MLSKYLGICLGVAFPSLSWGLNQIHSCVEFYEQNNFEQGFAQCLQEAQNQDPQAQYFLGMMYKRGKGTPIDHQKAMHWLLEAANGGNAAAQLRLGKILSQEALNNNAEYVKIFHYFEKAAVQKLPEAQFLLALCYQNGLGVNRDKNKAIYWFNEAVANGLEEAPFIPLSTTRTTSIKNQKGNEEFQTGLNYARGTITEQDDAKALYWLNRAADLNHPLAQSYLAWMAAIGLGRPQNLVDAIQWFLRAQNVKNENISPVMFISSYQGETQKLARNQFEKGKALLEGTIEDPDIQLGLTLLEQSARLNFTPAQFYLATVYREGNHVEKNPIKAANFMEKAARGGNLQAQYALGWMYFNGSDGVTKNLHKAYDWFLSASQQGDPKALSAKQFVQTQINLAAK